MIHFKVYVGGMNREFDVISLEWWHFNHEEMLVAAFIDTCGIEYVYIDGEKKQTCNGGIMEEENDRCPECGGEMRLKSGRYGEFWDAQIIQNVVLPVTRILVILSLLVSTWNIRIKKN